MIMSRINLSFMADKNPASLELMMALPPKYSQFRAIIHANMHDGPKKAGKDQIF